ncbi:hypothetical protein C0389_03035 [bacterium]|nr:hypothetical protein [bacterium]
MSIYLFLNTGISIATHYCGDEIYSVSLETNPTYSGSSDCCGDADCFSRCKTEYTFIKIFDSQKVEAVKDLNYLQAAHLPRYNSQNDRINPTEQTFPQKVEQFPPGSSICIINCIFLI